MKINGRKYTIDVCNACYRYIRTEEMSYQLNYNTAHTGILMVVLQRFKYVFIKTYNLQIVLT